MPTPSLLGRLRRVDGDLVVGVVALLDAEVEIIRSMSRYGWISLSLIICQMIRVISSPSISTTGLATLIFAMRVKNLCIPEGREKRRERNAAGRAPATAPAASL